MSALLKRNQEARVKEIARELLLLLPGTERALHLNETASLVYALCDGTRTASDVEAELLAEQNPTDGAAELSRAVSECISVLLEQEALLLEQAPRNAMILQFGPRIVEVEFDDPVASKDARDVLAAWQVSKDPEDSYAVSSTGNRHEYHRNDEHWFSSGKDVHPLPHLLRALWGSMSLDLGPCLHAALLSSNSRPLLLIGESGQGKSTLSRLLVGRGLGYLTDEISYCDDSHAQWLGVSKPLAHKASNSLFPPESAGYGPFSTPDKGDIFYWNPEQIPIDSQGCANSNPLVIFPEFDPGAEPLTAKLGQAATIHGSLMHFFDTGHTLEERGNWLVRAFEDAEGIRLRYGDAERAADLIRDLVS